MGWQPNGMRRSDVVLIRRGTKVFGPVGEVCKSCESERVTRVERQVGSAYWTHAIYLASSDYGVYHLSHLNRYLDGEKGETFCQRRFSWVGQI
jgi:hypothetical protein